jgi:hypothetical protein
MFPITLPTSPETIAFLTAETNEESDYQQEITQARDYNEGRQFVALTKRLRQFLGGDTANDSEDWKRLRLNICHIILSAVVDRLIVAGFDTDEAPRETPAVDENGQPTTKLIKPVAAWAWNIWQRNRMDAKQRRVHESALRDSEAFVLVDWDNASKRPRFTPHQRFVDVSTSAHANVGEGCRAFYRNDDSDQDLLFVTKRWTEVLHLPGGTRQTRQRLTAYLPGEIRKYAGFPGAWKPTQDNDAEPWPIPWLDKQGQPMGIPVAHFISSAGMEAREAWPIQNAINKAFVDMMEESDRSAFRIMLAFGWKPVDSAGNPLEIAAGKWMGSEKAGATAEAIPGGDLAQFMNLIDSLMLKAAIVTDTPTSRFITTRQVQAEGSQKEGNEGLLTKTRNRESEMSTAWAHAMYIAMRLENTYGKGGLNEDAFITTTFEPLEARDELAELQRATLRKALGMPIQLIARELGMTPEDASLWIEQAAQAQEQAIALAQAAKPVATGPVKKTVERDAQGRIASVTEGA